MPSGSGSKVTWSFGYDFGSSPLKRWKALALDGFIGAEYRVGLDKLKARIEEDRRPLAPAPGLVPQPGGASGTSTQFEQQPSAALPPGAPASGHTCHAGAATPRPQERASQWRSGCRHAGRSADRRSGHAGTSGGATAEEARHQTAQAGQ